MNLMSNYEYDNLRDLFAGFVADNAHLGEKVVTKFIRERRVKYPDKFPCEKTIYNWYYMLTGIKKNKGKNHVRTNSN